MTSRFMVTASLLVVAAGVVGLGGEAYAGGPGWGPPMMGHPGNVAPPAFPYSAARPPAYHGGFGPGPGKQFAGWNRPGWPNRFGGYGGRPFNQPGFFNQPYAGFWNGPWQNDPVTTVYTVPQTQRFEIAPELPVVTGGYQRAPVGAPVLYVINAPAGRPKARVVDVGAVKPIGPPSIGPDGDQTPRIVDLTAR